MLERVEALRRMNVNHSIESRLSGRRWSHLRDACILGLLLPLLYGQYANAQGRYAAASPTSEQSGAAQRTRLILKDGSYQLVLGYKVIGNVVRYRSAERNDETEDVPLSLVDLPATERWQSDHARAQSNTRPVLSPELEREEAARRALTPEVAPDLHLPEEDSVLALDTYRGTPELVPVPQDRQRPEQGDRPRRIEVDDRSSVRCASNSQHPGHSLGHSTARQCPRLLRAHRRQR